MRWMPRLALLTLLLLPLGNSATADDGPDVLTRALGFVTDPGELSSPHSNLAGDCSICHTPFAGQDSGKCVACHANNTDLLQRQPTAFHATIRRCGGCHVEHQGSDARIVRMDHETLALALAREFPPTSRPGASATSSRPGGPNPALKGEALERTLNCNQCHATHDPHRGLFGAGCSDCHTTSGWRINGYRHPSPTSRDCVQCHLAPPSHYMEHFHMISEKVVGFEHVDVRSCYLCHVTTAWNEIRGVGWYKHH